MNLYSNRFISPAFVGWLYDKASVNLETLHAEFLVENYQISAHIEDFVCENTGIDRKLLISDCRDQELVFARQICFALLYQVKKFSYAEVGRVMGNRTHATIISGIKKLGQIYDTEPHNKALIDKLFRHFGAKFQYYSPLDRH